MQNFQIIRPAASSRVSMTRFRTAGLIVVYFAAYVALDWLSYVYPVVPLGITPWNPQTGLSMFLLMSSGLRFWPALLCAAIAADTAVRGATIPAPMLVAACAITAGYVAAAAMLTRVFHVRRLGSTRDLVVFFGVAAASTLIVACTFVGVHAAFGMVSLADILMDILRYWVGDLNGLLVVTPALFCIANAGNWRSTLRRLPAGEVFAQVGSLLSALGLIFAIGDEYPFRSFYVLVLPLIWISARWGLPGTALAQVLIQLGLIACVQMADYRAATFVQLQWLMTGLCITGLTVGAMSSHRRRLEEVLRDRQAALHRAQQFASAGEMTSALAHQLNQPLTALNGYVGACQILVRQTNPDVPRLSDLMTRIDGEVRRASECISRIRDFYRRGAVAPGAIEAGRLVDNVVRMVQHNADAAGVEIVLRQGPWDRAVWVDTVQVENAVQNVLINAIEASSDPASHERRIEITLQTSTQAVDLRFCDNGPGVPAEIVPELFEPFMTSKATGIGMGLAIARSLVRASGGDLRLEASTNRGACFLMSLPLSPSARGTAE
jgi:signal transduction histidine kinase